MSVSLAITLPLAQKALGAMIEGASLERALNTVAYEKDPDIRAATQSILYTYTRQRILCDELIARLASTPPSDTVKNLLALALSELLAHPDKDYSIVNETINAAKKSRKTERAAGFINACLRRFGREKDALLDVALQSKEALYNAPLWYIEALEASLGKEKTYELFRVAAQHPRLILRVNHRKTTPEAWCKSVLNQGTNASCLGNDAVMLASPMPVTQIPGFSEGLVSVQDAGAQLAAIFLAPPPGATVLDACAAPGGKTAHLLERFDVQVTALEVDPSRAAKINETLERLGLKARTLVADAANPDCLDASERFDAILLDAPCTASGIIRRHPDIVFNRRIDDIDALAKQQKTLLEALWPRLKFGGKLLYVVCSVFEQEGLKQIRGFLERHRDAHLVSLPLVNEDFVALCPTEDEPNAALPRIHDGFFYALLTKK